MTQLLIVFAAISVLVGLLAAIARKQKPAEAGQAVAQTAAPASCATCSGQTDACLKDCLLEAASEPIAYYDDEELDTFCGRPASDYTDDEVEQFAEVLHTMRPDEVRGWLASLNLRHVEIPDALKDEAFMLMEEP